MSRDLAPPLVLSYIFMMLMMMIISHASYTYMQDDDGLYMHVHYESKKVKNRRRWGRGGVTLRLYGAGQVRYASEDEWTERG